MNDKAAHLLAGALQFFGALPLAAYPAVLVANIMQAAARPDPKAPRALRIIVGAFVAASTAYPLVFGLSLAGSLRALGRGESERGVALNTLPLVWLAVVGAVMALWGAVERKE